MLPIAAVGPKITIFKGGNKSFCTSMTENHLVTLFAWLFGWAWDEMGQKGQCLAKKKPTFGQKSQLLSKFGQKIHCFGGREKNFWYLHIREPMRHLFRVKNNVFKTLNVEPPIDH